MKVRILVCLFALSFNALASPVPEFPFVIVTERFEERVRPDVARVSLSVAAFAEDSQLAAHEMEMTLGKVAEVLGAHGIPLNQVETDQIYKNTRRAQRDGAYELEVLGYDIAQSVTVTLTDLEVYPALISDLLRVDGVHGIRSRFSVIDEDELEARALDAASKVLRSKAEALAAAQSRKLKAVYGITTQDTFGRALATFALDTATGDVSISQSILPGERGLAANVPRHITFTFTLTGLYALE